MSHADRYRWNATIGWRLRLATLLVTEACKSAAAWPLSTFPSPLQKSRGGGKPAGTGSCACEMCYSAQSQSQSLTPTGWTCVLHHLHIALFLFMYLIFFFHLNFKVRENPSVLKLNNLCLQVIKSDMEQKKLRGFFVFCFFKFAIIGQPYYKDNSHCVLWWMVTYPMDAWIVS